MVGPRFSLITDPVVFLIPKADLYTDTDFPSPSKILPPGKVCHPEGLWEAASFPVVQNLSRRGLAASLLSNGPTAPITPHQVSNPSLAKPTPVWTITRPLGSS